VGGILSMMRAEVASQTATAGWRDVAAIIARAGHLLLQLFELFPKPAQSGELFLQVSASISNYIRVLMADPGAFEILKARKWAADRTKIAS